MGSLTTHVLDLVTGRPAVGMAITLRMIVDGDSRHMLSVVTNADGRVAAPLLQGAAFRPGVYQLEFAVGAYFGQQDTAGGELPFLDIVPLRFGVADADAHYHVPLLVTPWAYSTYRGS
jgi:5-hydroxyisourate hydrolase